MRRNPKLAFSLLQSQERALILSARLPLDLGLPASQNYEKISVKSPRSLWYFVMAAWMMAKTSFPSGFCHAVMGHEKVLLCFLYLLVHVLCASMIICAPVHKKRPDLISSMNWWGWIDIKEEPLLEELLNITQGFGQSAFQLQYANIRPFQSHTETQAWLGIWPCWTHSKHSDV